MEKARNPLITTKPHESEDFASFDWTTALVYATRRVPVTHPDERAGAVLHQMSQADRFDAMADVAVIETGHLVGLLPIEVLFAASPDTLVTEIMGPDPPVIGPGVDQEIAAARRWRTRRAVSVLSTPTDCF